MKIVQNNDDNAPQTHMNRIAAGEQLHWKYAVLYTMLGWVHWCSKVHCCTWTASAQFDALRPNPELLCLPYSWCLCFGTLHQQSHHTFSIRKSHTPTDKQTALQSLYKYNSTDSTHWLFRTVDNKKLLMFCTFRLHYELVHTQTQLRTHLFELASIPVG